MATSFLDIYTRVMSQIKDPNLVRLQNNNLIKFCYIMNASLATGRTYYNPNYATEVRLSNTSEQMGDMQYFNGDGTTTDFVIGTTFPSDSETLFSIEINETTVTNYVYDDTTKSIKFDVAPNLDDKIQIDMLNSGSFNGDITLTDVTLLTLATCWAWATQVQNNRLDIDRSLNDTSDFRQHAEGTTTNAKVSWAKHFEEMYKRELSKTDWRSKFRAR